MAEELDRDEYFRGKYNTPLSADEEQQFQDWIAKQGKKLGRDMADDEIDYDMRGAWKAGAGQADNGHFPDQFKKPNHPTFSAESQYHGTTDEEGRPNEGGRWITDKDGRYVAFEQSNTNREHWPEWAMQDYLQRAEPGVKLQKARAK